MLNGKFVQIFRFFVQISEDFVQIILQRPAGFKRGRTTFL